MGLVGRACAAIVAVVAICVGLLVSGFAADQGFFIWLAKMQPPLVGLGPVFTDYWDRDYSQVAALDLSGQTALVTGANSGLGYWTAHHLARQGAHVILACRTPAKCDEAAAQIRANHSQALVEPLLLDTASGASVRALVADVLARTSALDILVLNAGIHNVGGGVVPTTDLGPEKVLATNHFGHFLMYKGLLPALEEAAKARGSARVVVVSSASHYSSYPYGVALTLEDLAKSDPAKLYEQSKLANVLFAQEAQRRLGPDSKIFVNSLHPGLVNTNIFVQFRTIAGEGIVGDMILGALRRLVDVMSWTGEEGALTQVWLAAAAGDLSARGIRGRYFHPQMREVAPDKHTANLTLQQAFWDFSETVVGSV